MATREEVLTNLTKAAKQGNIRDAYRDFEELPFVDQVAISISPGIGDALAVYEIGEFGARGAKNIEEKDQDVNNRLITFQEFLSNLNKKSILKDKFLPPNFPMH